MSLLRVDDVVVQFGGVTAVDHATFEVDPGTVTGLIGPNGAGKTTCFNVITGLQAPTSGRIVLDGHDITRMPVHRRARRGIGRTFQRLEAFGSLTVWDNVRTALDIHEGIRGLFSSVDGSADRDVAELLERVGIAAYAAERADSIPTGVARLLELARALAWGPGLRHRREP
jgi:branched-chain amino acid transport system ATP-binding protein